METIEYKGFKIEISQDENDSSPRDWDNIGKMVCSHRSYDLGDEKLINNGISLDEDFAIHINSEYNVVEYGDYGESDLTDKQKEKIGKWIDENIVYEKLYLMDHSGLLMNTRGYSCGRDSGQVGYIYVSKDTIRKEYNIKNVTKKYIKTAEQVLEAEVEFYSSYLSGEIYRYYVEELDISCGGYYEIKDLEEDVKSEIDAYIKHKYIDHINYIKQCIKSGVNILYRKPLQIK